MIRLLYGENGFALKQTLDQLKQQFISDNSDSGLEQIEATNIDAKQLESLLGNASLFSQRRMIVLRDVDENKEVADKLPELLDKLHSDIDLVLVAAKPDKRTRWYKSTTRLGQAEAMDELREPQLVDWAITRAKQLDAKLDRMAAKLLVEKVGLNQWQVASELNKLATYSSDITQENIDKLVDQSVRDSVFDLLDAVIRGQSRRAQDLYDQLRLRDIDGHQFVGLMAWQLHNLLVVKTNFKLPVSRLAAQAGLAPFVVDKTRRLTTGLSLQQMKKMVELTIEADGAIKKTRADVDQRIKLLIDQIELVVH